MLDATLLQTRVFVASAPAPLGTRLLAHSAIHLKLRGGRLSDDFLPFWALTLQLLPIELLSIRAPGSGVKAASC